MVYQFFLLKIFIFIEDICIALEMKKWEKNIKKNFLCFTWKLIVVYEIMLEQYVNATNLTLFYEWHISSLEQKSWFPNQPNRYLTAFIYLLLPGCKYPTYSLYETCHINNTFFPTHGKRTLKFSTPNSTGSIVRTLFTISWLKVRMNALWAWVAVAGFR